MGPREDRPSGEKNQAGHFPTAGRTKRARRPRSRACLLKGCEQRFRPVRPLARYCSPECREEARRWREWKARHRYRQSEGGKQKRRAQSRRYRMHRRAGEAQSAPGERREGHRKKNYLVAPATARAATSSSNPSAARRCSDFARPRVGGLGSGFGSENDAGGNGSRRGTSDGSRARGVEGDGGELSGDGPEILRLLSRGE
jgi:hypothetical protein